MSSRHAVLRLGAVGTYHPSGHAHHTNQGSQHSRSTATEGDETCVEHGEVLWTLATRFSSAHRRLLCLMAASASVMMTPMTAIIGTAEHPDLPLLHV